MKYVSPDEMSCKSGGAWERPGGDVFATEEGVEACAEICRAGGYQYFGLECPGELAGHQYPPAMVHCQCANDLATSNKLDDAECNSQNN
jgi:hypothetical protein